MTAFTSLDFAAFAWFLGAWLGYSLLIENTAKGRSGLNALMNTYRDDWMERLLARDMRMVDAQVTAALQNGTAFFASTSLIAVGGTLTLLRSADQILTVVSALPFGAARLCADAGRHFNRGQRAFFFALGYLGWFLGPLPLAITTSGIVIVMWRRQFASDSRLAFSQTPPAPPTG